LPRAKFSCIPSGNDPINLTCIHPMFTGIVEATGRVVAFRPEADAWKLHLAVPAGWAQAATGDSIAVNGCCLTLTRGEDGQLHFDVLEETRRLTNFAALRPGATVNLERSLRFNGEMGGHFVSGHIDTQGTIERFEARGKDHYLRVRVPREFARYLVYKGSVAIDGISLTVAETEGDYFAVWLIPHTLAATNLRERHAGEGLNLEFDLLAKYVEKLMLVRLPSPPPS
jgi:riboflavin synthase